MERIDHASAAQVAGIATTATESGVNVVNGAVGAAALTAACGPARSGSVTTDEPSVCKNGQMSAFAPLLGPSGHQPTSLTVPIL
jgi:hypothetical protein